MMKPSTVLLLAYACCLPLLATSFFQKIFSSTSAVKPSSQAEITTIKESISKLAKNKDNGIKASPQDKASILELAKRLEKFNPSSNIATSAKMDGEWFLVYTSNAGSSAGKLGPFVGQVVQDIDMKSVFYTNYAIFGNGLVEAALDATWSNLNPKLWEVKFQKIVFKIAGIKVVDKPLEAVGLWRMTYLDDDYRVLYTSVGKSTPPKESLFILAKKKI
jgi:PAP_fibrillin